MLVRRGQLMVGVVFKLGVEVMDNRIRVSCRFIVLALSHKALSIADAGLFLLLRCFWHGEANEIAPESLEGFVPTQGIQVSGP
jgi:hypothetical protein